MTTLSGKIAIITGAGSGIGRTAATLFAREGAKLVVGARRVEKLNALVDDIISEDGEAVALAGDVASEAYNKALVDLAVSKFGKLDIAFNNAGTLGTLVPLPELSREDWDASININLTSAYLAAKYQIPAMLENGGGSVIFTSSVAGNTVAIPTKSAYAAAKAGLTGLTKTLAVEYGAQGVRFNALLPGATATPMLDQMGTDPESIQFLDNIHALKRCGQPEEVAQAAMYLASDAASFVTGTSMLVDGGVSICKT
ncbi:MAG: SDR family oxidoreductase [Rickettsiales bacterium]|nr:SDR family oxidoreductase [Rickettsiales bacterium]